MTTKWKIVNQLSESGIVAVIRKIPEDKVERVAERLINGGITALEVTVDDPKGFEIIKRLTDRFNDVAIIGAGTVLDSPSAKLAIDSGAQFVVSPILSEEVIKMTRRYGKVSIPAGLTPTEALNAIEMGGDIVKVFPASSVGAAFIKQMRGPLSQIPIIPTGGINVSNIADFIKAGAVAVGAGSQLVNDQLINSNNFAEIEKMAIQYVNEVKKAREY